MSIDQTPPARSPISPVFIGGTVRQHVLFVASTCRYDHQNVPLCFVHYLTWSVMQVSLFVIAFALFGPFGAIVYGAAMVGWAVRMDVLVGLIYGVLFVGYGFAADFLMSGRIMTGTASAITVGAALACAVAALAVEASAHIVFTGRPPLPPSRNTTHLSAFQLPMLGLYFAVLFGLFFLTLDLAMRFAGYRRELNREANAVTNDWHRVAAEAAQKPSVRDWHLRAIACQS